MQLPFGNGLENKMQELDEIWNLVLEELKKNHSPTVISLWISDLKLISLTDTDAVLFTESALKKDVLEKKLYKSISDCFETVIGYSINAVFTNDKNFEVKKEAAPERREEKIKPDAPEENAFLISPENKGAGKVRGEISHSSQYTFDNFIVGSSNRFAHAACTAVSQKPADSYNPLFIYGPSGLGKTHLLYAITNEIHKNFPESTIIYVKGEEFTNQMIESISRGLTGEFREKYRKADVLLIDDIHFIAGKEATQEEFFHTFNDLYEHGKQIILTSDRPAKDIKNLEERLRTRFEWGISADIQPPDFELRMAIMQNKAQTLGKTFPNDVLNFLAEKLTNNIRQIEGAIKKIIAFSFLSGEEITIPLVTSCISDLLSASGQVTVTPKMIIKKVSMKYGIDEKDILSEKRASNISQTRHICIYIMKKVLELSYPAIGKVFSKDHTTMMSSYKRIEKEIKNNSAFEIEINELIKEITS